MELKRLHDALVILENHGSTSGAMRHMRSLNLKALFGFFRIPIYERTLRYAEAYRRKGLDWVAVKTAIDKNLTEAVFSDGKVTFR